MSESNTAEDTERNGIELQTRTTCNIGGVDDKWDTAEIDSGDEIRDAIETVRDDHDERVTVRGENLWMFEVYWNDNTDSVWVARFGYNGGMEVTEP